MKKVLLITHSDDNECIDTVSEALLAKGGMPVRLNSDLYPSEILISSENRNGTWRTILNDGHTIHDLADFESVWFRRSQIGDALRGKLDNEFVEPSIKESKESLIGILATLDIFHMETEWRMNYASIKMLQLQVAQELGLLIPNTLITSRKDKVRPFYDVCDKNIIAKMQVAFSIYKNGIEYSVFTNKMEENDLNDLEGIEFAPMTFQQNIEKQLELRVTIVGNQVFTSAIDSQLSEKAKHDWRRDGAEMVKHWVKFELPDEIKNKLLAYMDYFQLNYGAADLILTGDGLYYFLELNPAGEFFWLDEQYGGHPISKAIADVLLGNVPRRKAAFPTPCPIIDLKAS